MSATTTCNRLLAASYDQPLIEATGPQQNPGELANWPMLKVSYRTDKDKIARLLPPGLEPDDSALVLVTFYNLPIQNAPEYGIAINVAANHKGTAGEYTLVTGLYNAATNTRLSTTQGEDAILIERIIIK